MAVVNSKALLPLLLVLLQSCLHCQKSRCCCCCCWQIDLQANTEILFFKRSLSVFIGAAGALHGNQVWGNYSSYHSSFFPRFWSHYLIFNGCNCTVCLTTKRHPGSPAKEDQYLNYAVVGQHVRAYKIKWGLKLISSSPWKSLQVFWNETKRRSAAERRWPPPRQIHNCFCFSKLNEPFYYYYYFYIAELGVRNCQLWHVRF